MEPSIPRNWSCMLYANGRLHVHFFSCVDCVSSLAASIPWFYSQYASTIPRASWCMSTAVAPSLRTPLILIWICDIAVTFRFIKIHVRWRASFRVNVSCDIFMNWTPHYWFHVLNKTVRIKLHKKIWCSPLSSRTASSSIWCMLPLSKGVRVVDFWWRRHY